MRINPFWYGCIVGFIIAAILFWRGCCPDSPALTERTVTETIDSIPQPEIHQQSESIAPKPLPKPVAKKTIPSIDTSKQNLYIDTLKGENYVLTIKSLTTGTLDYSLADLKITPPPLVTKTITIHEPCPVKWRLYVGLDITTNQSAYASAIFIPKSGKKAYRYGFDPLTKSHIAGAYFNIIK